MVSKPIILNQLYQTYSPIVFLAFLKFADSDFVCSLAFTVCESVVLCMLLDGLPGGPADECVGPFETLRKGAFARPPRPITLGRVSRRISRNAGSLSIED